MRLHRCAVYIKYIPDCQRWLLVRQVAPYNYSVNAKFRDIAHKYAV